jgi:hypothetical protein
MSFIKISKLNSSSKKKKINYFFFINRLKKKFKNKKKFLINDLEFFFLKNMQFEMNFFLFFYFSFKKKFEILKIFFLKKLNEISIFYVKNIFIYGIQNFKYLEFLKKNDLKNNFVRILKFHQNFKKNILYKNEKINENFLKKIIIKKKINLLSGYFQNFKKKKKKIGFGNFFHVVFNFKFFMNFSSKNKIFKNIIPKKIMIFSDFTFFIFLKKFFEKKKKIIFFLSEKKIMHKLLNILLSRKIPNIIFYKNLPKSFNLKKLKEFNSWEIFQLILYKNSPPPKIDVREVSFAITIENLCKKKSFVKIGINLK